MLQGSFGAGEEGITATNQHTFLGLVKNYLSMNSDEIPQWFFQPLQQLEVFTREWICKDIPTALILLGKCLS